MVLLKSVLLLFLIGLYIKSTFHYGSIKIGSLELDLRESSKSTFHYGSIKIRMGR